MATAHHTMDALENTLMANGALQSHLARCVTTCCADADSCVCS